MHLATNSRTYQIANLDCVRRLWKDHGTVNSEREVSSNELKSHLGGFELIDDVELRDLSERYSYQRNRWTLRQDLPQFVKAEYDRSHQMYCAKIQYSDDKWKTNIEWQIVKLRNYLLQRTGRWHEALGREIWMDRARWQNWWLIEDWVWLSATTATKIQLLSQSFE